VYRRPSMDAFEPTEIPFLSVAGPGRQYSSCLSCRLFDDHDGTDSYDAELL
jgi:hypothetical protein